MNPGPEILPLSLYMHSSGIESHIRVSPETEIFGCQPEDLAGRAQALTDSQPVESTLRIRFYRRKPVERHGRLSCQCVVIIVCDYI